MLPSIVLYIFFAALSLYYEYKFYTSVETYEFRTKFLKLITLNDLSLFYSTDDEGVCPYGLQTIWKPVEEYPEEPSDNSNTSLMIITKDYREEVLVPSRTIWVPTKTLKTITDNECEFSDISSCTLTKTNNYDEGGLQSRSMFFLLHIMFSLSVGGIIVFLTIRRLTFDLYHRHIFLESPRPCPRRVRRPRHPHSRPLPRMATWDSLPQGPVPLPLRTRVEKQLNPEWEMRRYRWE